MEECIASPQCVSTRHRPALKFRSLRARRRSPVLVLSVRGLKNWCAREDLNLFSHFVAEGNSGLDPINKSDSACRPNLTFANFCALMQLSCHHLSSNQPKYFTRCFSNPSRFFTLSNSAKQDFLNSAMEATFRMILRFFS